MEAIGALLGGTLGLIFAILMFVGVLGTWSNTGKIEKHLGELLRLKRIEKGLDPETGKLPGKKE